LLKILFSYRSGILDQHPTPKEKIIGMNYEEALAFLQAFPDMERATFGARGPTMGLPSMKSLLNRMGDPA
jgi:hypothetical protein